MPAASHWRPVTISHTVPRAAAYRSHLVSWQRCSAWQLSRLSASECKMSNDQQAWVQYAVFLHAMVTRWERKQHSPYVVRLSAVSSAPDLGSSHVGFVDQFRCHTRQFRCAWNCPRFCVAYLLGAKSIKWTPDGLFTPVMCEICWVGFSCFWCCGSTLRIQFCFLSV